MRSAGTSLSDAVPALAGGLAQLTSGNGSDDGAPTDELATAFKSSAAQRRVLVIGAGSRFLSGISYYTNRLINALGREHRVSAILIRQMLPTRLYPGRDR